MNQYFIALLVWIASLTAVGFYENHVGHVAGTNAQKVVDQKEFDRIEAERTQQKAEANALYQKAQADIIALQAARDKLKTDLEVNDAKNRKATLVLNANLATAKLQFRTAQGAGDRQNCAGTVSGTANTAGTDGTAVVQLPDALTARLRQHALAADQLKDEYAKCYGYATKIK